MFFFVCLMLTISLTAEPILHVALYLVVIGIGIIIKKMNGLIISYKKLENRHISKDLRTFCFLLWSCYYLKSYLPVTEIVM